MVAETVMTKNKIQKNTQKIILKPLSLYTKTHNIFKTEPKRTLEKREEIYSWSGRISLVEMPPTIYCYKTPAGVYRRNQRSNSKLYTEKTGTGNCQRQTEPSRTLPDFKIYYRTTSIKGAGALVKQAVHKMNWPRAGLTDSQNKCPKNSMRK